MFHSSLSVLFFFSQILIRKYLLNIGKQILYLLTVFWKNLRRDTNYLLNRNEWIVLKMLQSKGKYFILGKFQPYLNGGTCKKWKYNEIFLQFGLTFHNCDGKEQPLGLICNKILAMGSVIKTKITSQIQVSFVWH